MEILNLSTPGTDPVVGDWVEIRHDNGAIERRYFSAPEVVNPRRAEILKALAEIDGQTTKPRTLRELSLGNAATLAWVAAKDAEAEALRAEMATL